MWDIFRFTPIAPKSLFVAMNHVNFQLSNLSKAKARVVFAIKNKSVAWENVIFVGIKKMRGMFAISQRIGDFCTLRLNVSPLRRTQYDSFFNEVVLQLHNRDNNCIFLQVRYLSTCNEQRVITKTLM